MYVNVCGIHIHLVTTVMVIIFHVLLVTHLPHTEIHLQLHSAHIHVFK